MRFVFTLFLLTAAASGYLQAAAVEPAQIEITGDWTIQVTDGGAAASFDLEKPAVVDVVNEKYDTLALYNPNGPEWHRATVLNGTQAQECSIQGALLPETVIVRLTPDGEPLVNGTDYQLDGPNGNVGRLEGGNIPADAPVYITYSYIPMRIDSIFRNADGTLSLAAGTPHVANPEIPALGEGQSRVVNIYFNAGPTAKLTEDQIFPILDDGALDIPAEAAAEKLLPKIWAKLQSGEPVKILAWGDSVTACGYIPDNERWQVQFVDRLKERFPTANIELVTEAWGGRNSDTYFAQPAGAEHNYQEKVLDVHPDLIVSEFVNDAGFDAAKVEQNYGRMRDDFAQIGAEWIILAPHYVRPAWMGLSSQRNIDNDPRPYVVAIRDFAARNNIALADGSALYGQLWRRGIPYITLMKNNINHPNGFGMSLFVDALMILFGTDAADNADATQMDIDAPAGKTVIVPLTLAGLPASFPVNRETIGGIEVTAAKKKLNLSSFLR